VTCIACHAALGTAVQLDSACAMHPACTQRLCFYMILTELLRSTAAHCPAYVVAKLGSDHCSVRKSCSAVTAPCCAVSVHQLEALPWQHFTAEHRTSPYLTAARCSQVSVYGLVDERLAPRDAGRELGQKLPRGAAVAILEPFFKRAEDGSCVVRVDNPREVGGWSMGRGNRLVGVDGSWGLVGTGGDMCL
jgi:hypothetical protein